MGKQLLRKALYYYHCFHVTATTPGPSYMLSFRPLFYVAVLIVLLVTHSDNVDPLGNEVEDDDEE